MQTDNNHKLHAYEVHITQCPLHDYISHTWLAMVVIQMG